MKKDSQTPDHSQHLLPEKKSLKRVQLQRCQDKKKNQVSLWIQVLQVLGILVVVLVAVWPVSWSNFLHCVWMLVNWLIPEIMPGVRGRTQRGHRDEEGG